MQELGYTEDAIKLIRFLKYNGVIYLKMLPLKPNEEQNWLLL